MIFLYLKFIILEFWGFNFGSGDFFLVLCSSPRFFLLRYLFPFDHPFTLNTEYSIYEPLCFVP